MEKKIYTCATAHLDTVWNWDFEHTASVCLYNTLVKNFRLFEKYPDYKFNFEGAYRYELFEEYYPELFEKLKVYIADGRWNVAGSAYENGDVNVPSPEALFRNILYGNGYFHEKFGKRSKDIFLPDCFGFGYALPSVIHHANLLGFTTQKLSWGSAYGVPFDIGKWRGVDNNYCFASLNAGSYVSTYKSIRDDKAISGKLKDNACKYYLPWTFSFHGDGDQGGSPKDESAKVLQKEINENKDNYIKVISSASDEIFRDLDGLTDEQKNKLPEWNNELVMTNHGAGGYTSRAAGKRFNRKNEEIADMAERCAVAGFSLGNMSYPSELLTSAWKRVISHQFHDDLPGTSIQKAYLRSWNDYIISLNQFENEFHHSLGAVSSSMDTSWVRGTAVVVNNSIEQPRKDNVTVNISVKENSGITVKDYDGNVMPSQVIGRKGGVATVMFTAEMDSLGYKVYDISEFTKADIPQTEISSGSDYIENGKYKVAFNRNGEISSVFDKRNKKELLKSPIKNQMIDYNGSMAWPAWELTYKGICSDKICYPKLESRELLYSGASGVAMETVSRRGSSTFRTVVSLSAGGEYVKVENEVDWWAQKTLFKTVFNLNVSNSKATYDLGLGAIKRQNNTEKLFEVPAQKWADISEKDFGVSVFSDCKYGWDKPRDDLIRLTVLHTPKYNFLRESMQSLMDIGLNRYSFAVFSHGGDLTETQMQARCFNQPLTAIIAEKHGGNLGSSFSFGKINRKNIILRALKKAENGDEIIVRFNEGAEKATNDIHFSLGNGIESAKEMFASEEFLKNAITENGELVFNMKPYEIKTFSLKLKPFDFLDASFEQNTIIPEYNYRVFTDNDRSRDPVISDSSEFTLPKELNPKTILYKGIDYKLDDNSAVLCCGQKIQLSKKYDRLFLLAFSLKDDESCEFLIDGKTIVETVHSATECVGRWDMTGLCETANIKDCHVSYVFTHTHNNDRADIVAKQAYVFQYEFDVKGTEFFCLPDNKDIIVLALSAASNYPNTVLAEPLYDRVEVRSFKNKFGLREKVSQSFGRLPHNARPPAYKVKRDDGEIIK